MNLLSVDKPVGMNTFKKLCGYLLEVDEDNEDTGMPVSDRTWTSGTTPLMQPVKLDNCPHCCGSVGIDGYCQYCGSLVYLMNR